MSLSISENSISCFRDPAGAALDVEFSLSVMASAAFFLGCFAQDDGKCYALTLHANFSILTLVTTFVGHVQSYTSCLKLSRPSFLETGTHR
jgi:hypothetical protein